MRNLFFAALAAVTLGLAVIPAYAASTVAGDRAATLLQQSGAYSGGGN